MRFRKNDAVDYEVSTSCKAPEGSSDDEREMPAQCYLEINAIEFSKLVHRKGLHVHDQTKLNEKLRAADFKWPRLCNKLNPILYAFNGNLFEFHGSDLFLDEFHRQLCPTHTART